MASPRTAKFLELTENYWENLSTGGRSEARQTAANHRRNLDLMVDRRVAVVHVERELVMRNA